MKRILLLGIILFSLPVFSQDTPPDNLQERFNYMKEKSQSYNDYKVIKGTVLDGVWKITMDSIKAQRVLVRETKAIVDKLKGEVAQANNTIDEKDKTLAAMEHDVTHISVLGFDVNKVAFISMVGFIFLGLLVLAGLMFARLKYIISSTREKNEAANLLTQQFEDYKRNALDKQMKLSRELQDERNKLQELGHA